MNNIYYIYFLLCKSLNCFIITVMITLNNSNITIEFLTFIISIYYLLHKQNIENKFIDKNIYLSTTFLIKRIIEIIGFLILCLVNLMDIVLIFLIIDYIIKLTLDTSIYEIYYNTEIKIRRKNESKT
ncbi:MAG: hypothetical protein ACK5HR_05400 [Mycoplasmatales bacterium]